MKKSDAELIDSLIRKLKLMATAENLNIYQKFLIENTFEFLTKIKTKDKRRIK